MQRDSASLVRQRAQLDLSKIPAIAAATRRAGVWNCPTQIFYELAAREGGGLGEFAQVVLLEPRRRLIKALHDSGAGLLLGSDAGGGAVHLRTIHQELQELVRAGLTPYQALLTGTRNPAQLLGTSDSAGTVAAGRRADLVLLRGNPLTDVRNARQPAGVMIGGRWLPRAALDQRLAGDTPTARKAYYEEYANGAYESDLLYPLVQPWLTDTLGRVLVTAAERTALRDLLSAHRARQAALVDSLAAPGPSASGLTDPDTLGAHQQRILRLVGGQLAELRAAALPRGQVSRFDTLAGAWERLYTSQGFYAAIKHPATTRPNGVDGERP